jgi:hypothetical protein
MHHTHERCLVRLAGGGHAVGGPQCWFSDRFVSEIFMVFFLGEVFKVLYFRRFQVLRVSVFLAFQNF